MSTIILQPERLTAAHLHDLEERGLVRTLTPPRGIIAKPDADMVEPLYVAATESGSHQLICVRKNQTQIRLTRHSDNEEVIFLNPHCAQCKPLYLVIAYHPLQVVEKKAQTGILTHEDFRAFEIVFNEPATLIFSILKETLHCEVTVPGSDEAPLFYVTEPAAMAMHYDDLVDIALAN